MSAQEDLRRLATALPGVTERTSYGRPAFYVAGRIIARLHEEDGVLVCWRDSLEARDALLAADPDKFFTTNHYRDHPSVLVRLHQVDPDELLELLTEAWHARAPSRLTAQLEVHEP